MMAMSVKELKIIARQYAVNFTTCYEKSDIINLINTREIRNKLPNECLARYAVRYAYNDRTRNVITEEELCFPTWNLRVKRNGRLEEIRLQDPWWTADSSSRTGGTSTTVKFSPEQQAQLRIDGPSPFASMLPDTEDSYDFQYEIQHSGRAVYLSFGVVEEVFRHPLNWGFMMCSEGTVWTGFPMPRKGDDPLIEDPAVEMLRRKATDFGFAI